MKRRILIDFKSGPNFALWTAAEMDHPRTRTHEILEILTTGSLENGTFLLKQSVSIFRATAHALHLTGFY